MPLTAARLAAFACVATVFTPNSCAAGFTESCAWLAKLPPP